MVYNNLKKYEKDVLMKMVRKNFYHDNVWETGWQL